MQEINSFIRIKTQENHIPRFSVIDSFARTQLTYKGNQLILSNCNPGTTVRCFESIRQSLDVKITSFMLKRNGHAID